MQNFKQRLDALIAEEFAEQLRLNTEAEAAGEGPAVVPAEVADELMAACTAAILDHAAKFPTALRPYTFHAEGARFGAKILSHGIEQGAVEPETLAVEFTNALSFEAEVHVLFQLIGACVDLESDGPSRHGKRVLLELTDVMGADYAQAFYRFAVLYTKVV